MLTPHGEKGWEAGCRCPRCQRARNAYLARKRRRGGVQPPEHGYSGYVNFGCRCRICCKGHSDGCFEHKQRRVQRGVPTHLHGTYNAYSNYGCRCSRCRQANTEYARDYKRRTAGKA